jgi:hypothetical protein
MCCCSWSARGSWLAAHLTNVLLLLVGPWLVAGCAFDISHISQQPAVLDTSTTLRQSWTLPRNVTISVGSGFSTLLRAGTRWTQVGQIAQGDVFRTRDQIVEVEASNMYEAYVVLKGSKIVGFYLPVEGTFTAASSPVAIELAPK